MVIIPISKEIKSINKKLESMGSKELIIGGENKRSTCTCIKFPIIASILINASKFL